MPGNRGVDLRGSLTRRGQRINMLVLDALTDFEVLMKSIPYVLVSLALLMTACTPVGVANGAAATTGAAAVRVSARG